MTNAYKHRPLSGKTAFVTGSGRGLGNAIAHKLASQGANIILHDQAFDSPSVFGEAKDLSEAESKFAEHDVDTMQLVGNIGDEKTVQSWVDLVSKRMGAIDILVNAAGGDIGASGKGKPVPNDALHIPIADLQAEVERNLIGTMIVCRSFVPPMTERKRGSIVFISSVGGHFGVSPEVTYATCKAAIIHYARCLALEMREYNVRVNVVSPGPTRSARFMATRKTDPAMMAEEGLKRYGLPQDIANAVAFFASDEASFVNGQVLRVDGGMTLFPG